MNHFFVFSFKGHSILQDEFDLLLVRARDLLVSQDLLSDVGFCFIRCDLVYPVS